MTHNGTLRTYDGAVAIVTGAASGIGRAMAGELARRGSHVVLADLQGELAEETAAAIRAAGGSATAQPLDVSDCEAVDRLVQSTFEAHGRLDYLFNNAGISIIGEVRFYEPDDWRRVLDVNLHGVVNGVQSAYPLMIRQGFGHIVNTASLAGLVPAPNVVSYTTSKQAVVGLSRALRVEAEEYGVRVSALCPGVVRTPILHGGAFGKSLVPLPATKPNGKPSGPDVISPERFAVKALNAVARNKAIIVIPRWWTLVWWLDRLSPSCGAWMGRKILRQMRAHSENAASAEATAASAAQP